MSCKSTPNATPNGCPDIESSEINEWLPFAEALLQCWLDGNRHTNREIFICPELGPVAGGYCLSTFPNSWEDKKILLGEINRLWNKLTA